MNYLINALRCHVQEKIYNTEIEVSPDSITLLNKQVVLYVLLGYTCG